MVMEENKESVVICKNHVFFSISPKKINIFSSILGKRKVTNVVEILSFSPEKGAFLFLKVFNGIVNELKKKGQDPSCYYVTKLSVNKSYILKRVSFRAKYQKDIIRKRFSYVNFLISKNLSERNI